MTRLTRGFWEHKNISWKPHRTEVIDSNMQHFYSQVYSETLCIKKKTKNGPQQCFYRGVLFNQPLLSF